MVRHLGYTIVGWHIDSADWCYNLGKGRCRTNLFKFVPQRFRTHFVSFILAQLREKKGGILLLHDKFPFTVKKLEELVTRIQAAGFKFAQVKSSSGYYATNR